MIAWFNTSASLAAIAISVVFSVPAAAQTHNPAPALARDSAYETNGNAFFLRGGYVFDSTNEAFDAFSTIPGLSDLSDTSAIYGSLGVRQKVDRAGRSMFSVEGEAIVARDTIDFDDGAGNFLDYREWIVAPQAGARWQYNFHGRVAPYASFGVGPAIVFDTVESSIGDFDESSVYFSYNGRAGLELAVSPRVGIEAGYRYLGVTDAATAGFHAGEIGLNLKF